MMTAGKLRLDDIVVELITENRITSDVYFSELPSPFSFFLILFTAESLWRVISFKKVDFLNLRDISYKN